LCQMGNLDTTDNDGNCVDQVCRPIIIRTCQRSNRTQGITYITKLQTNLHKVAAMDTSGNGVHLTPYRPFGRNTLLNSIRSDAYCIWHLAKVDAGKYRFYNECSRTTLRNGGSNLITAPDASTQYSGLWQFAKNGPDTWMQSHDVKKWMSTDSAGGTTLCVQDPGSH